MSQLIPGNPVQITSGRHRTRLGIIKQPETTVMWPDANGLTRITLGANAHLNAPEMDAYFLTTQFVLL